MVAKLQAGSHSSLLPDIYTFLYQDWVLQPVKWWFVILRLDTKKLQFQFCVFCYLHGLPLFFS